MICYIIIHSYLFLGENQPPIATASWPVRQCNLWVLKVCLWTQPSCISLVYFVMGTLTWKIQLRFEVFFFSRNLWFVNQGAPKEESHATQQNDLQNMPFCFDLGSFFVQDPFFRWKSTTSEKGMKISLVAGNGKKLSNRKGTESSFKFA